jgi:two-component system, OmpR family, response regulator
MRLLLIEDDKILGDGLLAYLQGEGHVVDWCHRLADVAPLDDQPYDAWLVDWQLPDGSGVDWLRSQRKAGAKTPALVLTARDQLSDRIRGLDSGADDYLVKPFDPEELSARLRAVCRRTAGSAGAWLRFGDVEIDLQNKQARVSGVAADLTAREWRLVEALVMRAGRTVSRADLESLVLGLDGEPASNTLEVHVSNIRRKLDRSFIETIRFLGYRVRP